MDTIGLTTVQIAGLTTTQTECRLDKAYYIPPGPTEPQKQLSVYSSIQSPEVVQVVKSPCISPTV